MLPGVAWCCLVLPDVAWCCLVLSGAAWCCLVLSGVAWCCLVLPGVAWCCLVLYGWRRLHFIFMIYLMYWLYLMNMTRPAVTSHGQLWPAMVGRDQSWLFLPTDGGCLDGNLAAEAKQLGGWVGCLGGVRGWLGWLVGWVVGWADRWLFCVYWWHLPEFCHMRRTIGRLLADH